MGETLGQLGEVEAKCCEGAGGHQALHSAGKQEACGNSPCEPLEKTKQQQRSLNC